MKLYTFLKFLGILILTVNLNSILGNKLIKKIKEIRKHKKTSKSYRCILTLYDDDIIGKDNKDVFCDLQNGSCVKEHKLDYDLESDIKGVKSQDCNCKIKFLKNNENKYEESGRVYLINKGAYKETTSIGKYNKVYFSCNIDSTNISLDPSKNSSGGNNSGNYGHNSSHNSSNNSSYNSSSNSSYNSNYNSSSNSSYNSNYNSSSNSSYNSNYNSSSNSSYDSNYNSSNNSSYDSDYNSSSNSSYNSNYNSSSNSSYDSDYNSSNQYSNSNNHSSNYHSSHSTSSHQSSSSYTSSSSDSFNHKFEAMAASGEFKKKANRKHRHSNSISKKFKKSHKK